jgi:hypothetical protein
MREHGDVDEERLEDLEPAAEDAESVVGGAVPRVPDVVKIPPPSGPAPIPYPNTGGDTKAP